MKIKALYIYVGLIVVGLVTIILISDKNGKEQANNINTTGQIPKDDIHKSFGSGNQPSSANVTAEFKKKMNELDTYISENPSDTVKIREYALLLASSHKVEEAIKYYNNILKIDNKRSDILSQLAILFFNKNDFKKSIEYLSNILVIEPNNAQAKYNLGVVEARIGDIAAAKKQWEDLLANHPNTKMSGMAKESLERLLNK